MRTISKKTKTRPLERPRKLLLLVVGMVGFEPTTPCSQSRCANQAALHPEYGEIIP